MARLSSRAEPARQIAASEISNRAAGRRHAPRPPSGTNRPEISIDIDKAAEQRAALAAAANRERMKKSIIPAMDG